MEARMKRLPVITDLSEKTHIAERRAALIAERKGWGIDLVHALDARLARQVICL
jgi:nucleotide-binding universal stress UspA family protein